MEYLNLYAHCNESWLFLEIFVTANIWCSQRWLLLGGIWDKYISRIVRFLHSNVTPEALWSKWKEKYVLFAHCMTFNSFCIGCFCKWNYRA
jgi:hypothetical protein